MTLVCVPVVSGGDKTLGGDCLVRLLVVLWTLTEREATWEGLSFGIKRLVDDSVINRSMRKHEDNLMGEERNIKASENVTV